MKLSEVFKALEDGIEVQYRANNASFNWIPFTYGHAISLNESKEYYEFRIKPKPLECWLNIKYDGKVTVYKNENDAIQSHCGSDVKVAVHMREVVDDQ